MKLTIEGTPDELKNVLQAICGSEEHEALKAVLYGNTLVTDSFLDQLNSPRRRGAR